MADEPKKPEEKEAQKPEAEPKDDLPKQEIPAGKMHVKVYAPFKSYFNGIADNLSAVNATGPFDILPQHKNFMTLLSACEIVIRNDGKEEKVKITRGVMHVKKDDVIVFLDV